MTKNNTENEQFTLMWFVDRGRVKTKIVSKKRMMLLAASSFGYVLATTLMSIFAVFIWVDKLDLVDKLISVKQDLFLSEVRYNEVFESAYLETPEAFILAESQGEAVQVEKSEKTLTYSEAGSEKPLTSFLPSENEDKNDYLASKPASAVLALGGDQPSLDHDLIKSEQNNTVGHLAGQPKASPLSQVKSPDVPFEFQNKAGDEFNVSITSLEKKAGGYKVGYRLENKLRGKRVAGHVFINVLGTVGSGQSEVSKDIFFPKQVSYDHEKSLAKGIRFADRFRIRRLKVSSQFLKLPKDFIPIKISVIATDAQGKLRSVAVRVLEPSTGQKAKGNMQAH